MASIKVKYHPSSILGQEGTIYYQIIHDRKVRQLNTPYHVMPDEWSDNLSITAKRRSSQRKAKIMSIRDDIRRDIERLTRIARKLESDGIDYTADDVVFEFRRYAIDCSLSNYMTTLILKFKQNDRTRTAETYTAALNSFNKFLTSSAYMDGRHGGGDIMLDSITPAMMEAYEAWHKKRGNSSNTSSFYTRILRAVYNRAVEDGIIEDKNPFRHVYTGVDKTIKRAITLAHIKKIKRLVLPPNSSLDYARDMFLMSFYLRGMSFIDMAYLKKSDLKNGSVIYRRRKTGQQLAVRWTDDMQLILDKYPNNPTKYLLPIIKTVGINERYAYKNAGSKINYNLKIIGRMVDIAIPLTLYVSRHSWASAAKAKGIPLSVISEGMGHDSETTTQIYLATLDSSIIDDANSIILRSL